MPATTVSVYNSQAAAIDVTVDERWDSRKLTTGDKAKDDIYFRVQGPVGGYAMDDIACQNGIYATAPANYGGLEFDHVEQIEHKGGGLWWGTAKYVSANNTQQTGQLLVNFDTSGRNEKIYVSIATSNKYPKSGTTAPDNKKTIGNTNDRVEGTDIIVPGYKLGVTFYLPNASVTTGYIGVLYSLTGTVNNGTFWGMNEGEALFLGAKGARRGRGDWEITFEFAGSPNATGLNIGGITGVAKKGWEYLWVRFEKNPSNGAMMETALCVYVEQVYQETDFSTLGIGTAFPVFP